MWQVKIRIWIKGEEDFEIVGVSVRFGKFIVDYE